MRIKIYHFINFILLLLVRLVVDEGGFIFRYFLAMTLISILTLIVLPSFLFCLLFFKLVLHKLCKNLIIPIPTAIGSCSMNDWRALIPSEVLTIDPFGLGLFPNIIILQCQQSFFELLNTQIQRANLWITLKLLLLL
jgi:hypothetical protein